MTKITDADGVYLYDSVAWSKPPLKGLSRCIKAEKSDAAVIITTEGGG